MKRRGGIVVGHGGGFPGTGTPDTSGDGAGGFALLALQKRGRRRVVSGVECAEIGFETFESSQFLGDPVEMYDFGMGGTAYRYTSGDASITILGNAFAPEVIARTGMEFSAEDTAGNISISIPKANPIAQMFVAYIPAAPVTVTIYRKHRADPEIVIMFIGKVVSCGFEGPEATLTCAPVRSLLQRRVPAVVFQSQCNWDLYGAGCGVLKASFKDSGVVGVVSGVSLTATVFGTRADGWFNNGWIELASGERRFIVSHVGTLVTLMNPFGTLTVGQAFDAYPGCDRTEAICASKFNNLVRHLGFPRIPTRNPYEGSIA